jgi:pimeloyl-ACP methyl ester carboxylesterase
VWLRFALVQFASRRPLKRPSSLNATIGRFVVKLSSSYYRRIMSCLLILIYAIFVATLRAVASTSYLSPEAITTHVIFAPRCSTIIYSSNRTGPIRPLIVDMKDPENPREFSIKIEGSQDFIAQALAPDCRTLALVSDHAGDGMFDVFLFDFRRATLRRIDSTQGTDEGKPVFAHHRTLLAYLIDGQPALYDYGRAKALQVVENSHRFQSLTWSEDDRSLFLEDERFDIWQYVVRTAVSRKVWSGTRPGYFTRTPFEFRHRLLFTADERTAFRQIYSLDLRTGALKRVYATEHDQFSPEELSDGNVIFRSDIGGNFVAVEILMGKGSLRSPANGVVYNFSLAFRQPLLLYSNDHLPTDLYWFDGRTLKPLIRRHFSSRQPAAITIHNRSGASNFLYMPSKKPRALLVWLHGGPHEQVSPRYNLYFDFLLQDNIAVYAVNYPGSTGFGKSYAMFGKSDPELLQIQLRSIDDDIDQLSHRMPALSLRMLVGVSYGSLIVHRLIAEHPELTSVVDFSGIATEPATFDALNGKRSSLSMLFVYGDNDPYSKSPERKGLISFYQTRARVSILVLPDEGHYIGRRDSIDAILRAIDAILGLSQGRANQHHFN